jgi:DNA-binding CsgD family transcriptional regulator
VAGRHDALDATVSIDSGGALMFFRQQRPQGLLHRFDPAQRQLPPNIYSSGPYALDPQYHLFLEGKPSGAYWLKAIAPDDFYRSEYYQTFCSKIGVADSIDVMWRIDENRAMIFFLQRRDEQKTFNANDVAALSAVLPIVFDALNRHYQLSASVPQMSVDDTTHLQVESTIRDFASSLLTPREREVLFYLLRGYSSALTAQHLATSDGTVKIHRKNIYRKLDIGSQAELFSLFINCIPFARPGSDIDPLDLYQSTLTRSSTTIKI